MKDFNAHSIVWPEDDFAATCKYLEFCLAVVAALGIEFPANLRGACQLARRYIDGEVDASALETERESIWALIMHRRWIGQFDNPEARLAFLASSIVDLRFHMAEDRGDFVSHIFELIWMMGFGSQVVEDLYRRHFFDT